MGWDFSGEKPIYSQLIDQLQLRILTGIYQPSSKVPSVRELSAQAAVNPNTMQKALLQLEMMGLMYSERTSGRYITDDKDKIMNIKNNLAKKEISDFLNKMSLLGFSKENVIDTLRDFKEE